MKLLCYLISVLSRGLPKTGQQTAYVSGDDGTYEAGWWVGRLFANNRTRFVRDKIDGDDIVFDRATGLTWAADGDEAGCYNGSHGTFETLVIYARDLTFAGYSDWRMPNYLELLSILKCRDAAPLIYPSFTHTVFRWYWSSTTNSVYTIAAYALHFSSGNVSDISKTSPDCCLRCVRGGL